MTNIIIDTLSQDVTIGYYWLSLESYAMNEPNRVVGDAIISGVFVIDITRPEAIPEIIEIKKSEGTYTFSIKQIPLNEQKSWMRTLIELDTEMSLDFVYIVSQDEEEVQILVDVSNVEIGEYVFAINERETVNDVIFN